MKTTPAYSLSNLIFLLLFVCVFISSSNTCNKVDEDLCINPDSVIASEINNRKIVMMGENLHHDFIMYKGLIKTLNNWLLICEMDDSRKFILNLVLEIDSATAGIIEQYIHTGNDSAIYHKIAPYWSMEDIEYIMNLRKVYIDIENINNKRINKIELHVLGFEGIGMNIEESYYRKNQQETERWFINERDKDISDKLMDYIKFHNNEQYLIYYGAAHLQNGYVNKNLGFTIPNEVCYGYYLNYYLKQAYGEDSVICFSQGYYSDRVFDETYLSKYSDSDVLVPSDKFPLNDVKPEHNYFIVLRHFIRPFVKYEPHLISMIFSRLVIEKLSERSTEFVKYLPGYKAVQVYRKSMQSASFITGFRFENSGELRGWLDSNPVFNGLERIDSKEYSHFVYSLLKDTVSKDNVNILRDLGFFDEDFTYYSKDSVRWHDNWKYINQKAKFINALGLYWIGYPVEKIEAKKYLNEYTGKDYSDPVMYLKWFRIKYYNYADN